MLDLEKELLDWETAGRYGTIEERIARGKLWQPYYSYIANKKIGSSYRKSEQVQKAVEFLLKEGIIRNSDHVLDLGAGTGSYSIELARHAAEVTAIDMNQESINILEGWAKQEHLTNIRAKVASWEEYSRDESALAKAADSKAFDVSFSAMCPAICNQEELLRIESMTKRTCCLLTVTRGSYEKCRKELMKGLSLKSPGGMVTEALRYVNVLYLMGRQPNMKCWSQYFTTLAKAEDLIDQYRVYFKIFGIEEDVSVPYMEKFFAERADSNGNISDECKMNYALVWWDVPEGYNF